MVAVSLTKEDHAGAQAARLQLDGDRDAVREATLRIALERLCAAASG